MNEYVQFNDIFRKKKVLVTGHTGFKGGWLTLWLEQLGANVVGFAQEPNTDPNLFELLKLENDFTSIIGDIRNFDQIYNVIAKHKPEFVFHLAAQPLVRKSYKDPVETLETNIMGVVNILEAVRQTTSVKVLINVTSDKCYDNKETIWPYRENDPMGGHDPYSVSKGCSELITSSYRNSFFSRASNSENKVSISSVRAGNVIGGGDWAEDRLIPEIIASLQNNETILIRSPKSTRPWQFVLEPLSGYLTLASKMYENPEKYSQAWNFGPLNNEYLRVEQIVELIIRIFGKGTWKNRNLDEIQHEAKLLALDITKAQTDLNWKPVLDIQQGTEWTVDWYNQYYSNADMKKLCKKQLSEYCDIALRHKISWCENK